jgi:trimeric autotransporter adhesin
MRNYARLIRCWIIFVVVQCALAVGSVNAAQTICVSSPTDLTIALANASFFAEDIHIVQGTYAVTIPSSQQFFFAAGTSLRGGYTANCAGRDISAGNTVLTASKFAFLYPSGDFTIEGMTFQFHKGMVIAADDGGGDDLTTGAEILIKRSEFTAQSGGMRVYWKADTDNHGDIRIVDSLIHDNVTDSSGYCPLQVDVLLGEPTVTLINNTFVDNTDAKGGFCFQNNAYFDGPGFGTLLAYNNIFYGNSSPDFFSDTLAASLFDNTIGTHSYPAGVIAIGTLTSNPKLDANFHPIESPPSPVINSGTSGVHDGLPGTDLEGRDRVVGSAPDRGAFESAIVDSVFQTVTSTSDSGNPGTLRAAINSINANGTGGIINFNIDTGCPAVITLQSALPDIVHQAHIYGDSQPGSSTNTLDLGSNAAICVILDGFTHAVSDGFTVPASDDDATSLAVRGMAFSGFTHAAINLRGGSGHIVSGIHTGGAVGGVALHPVDYGIVIGPGVHDTTIGGDATDYALRNIIGDATSNSIYINASSASTGAAHDNAIIDNYIGVGWSNPVDGDYTNRGDGGSGIAIGGYGNTIEQNYVAFNGAAGIHLSDVDAHDNTLKENNIGNPPGANTAGNATAGILIDDDSHDNTIQTNFIFGNDGAGIRVVSGQHNRLSSNGVFGNGAIGIDLAGLGVTPNDNDASAQVGDYANRGQNFPVLTAAAGGHFKGSVSGSLTTTPGTYRVDFFVSTACDASGYGQGESALGHANVTTPTIVGLTQTTATFNLPIAGYFLNGLTTITATATDSAGNTSEFSQCVFYVDDTLFEDGFGS